MDEQLLATLVQQGQTKEKEHAHSDEDHDDDHSTDNDSGSEYLAPSRPAITERSTGRQTGPKGVLADYAQHRQIERERQAADRLAQQTKMGRCQPSITTNGTVAVKKNYNDDEEGKGEDEEDELLRELMEELEMEDFEQNAALKSYRDMRIREMKAARPEFGVVLPIGQHNYVEAIDKEVKWVSVLVYLYEPNLRASQLLDDALAELAKKYIYAKFLRIRGQEADTSFDQYVLPGLLCYRGGLLVGNWMGIDKEIMQNTKATGAAALSVETLEAFLQDNNILGDSDQAIGSTFTKDNYTDDADDDDDI